MYLKSIRVVNMQSIRDYTFELPASGIIVFTGDNSNGKSIVVKTTRALTVGDIRHPKMRASLINRKSVFGEITYLRSDGISLTLHLQREAAGTFVSYKEPAADPIMRYLSDKSYKALVARFGLHYDEKSGISINIAEDEESLLFYKTPFKSNGSVIETATTDIIADKSIQVLTNLLSDLRKLRESYNQQMQTYLTANADLVIENTEPLEKKLEKLERCKRNLQSIYIPNIPEIKAVPNVHYIDIKEPVLPKIKYPRIIDINCTIPDITPVAEELRILKEHRCPTCGRGFDSDACEDPVHNGHA